METLTIDTIRRAARAVKAIAPEPQPRIIVSPYALKDSDERLFPVSKNRSKRIHKKLLKRFGGEFRKVPAIYRTPQGIIAHPALYAEIQRQLPPRA